MIKLIKIVSIAIGLLTMLVTAFNCKKDKANQVPTLTTVAITNVTETALTTGGVISADGGANVTSRGVCWSTKPNPTIVHKDSITINGSGDGVFASAVKGLKPVVTYYIRAYATNAAGTGYGNELTSNYSVVPVLTTAIVTAVSDSAVNCGGTIINNGGKEVTSRGVCWSNTKNPTIQSSYTVDGKGEGSFVSSLQNLLPNVTYYVRAYASNAIGTGYGAERSFMVSKILIKDLDGNLYHVINIGSQAWLAENLQTTRLVDSTSIALVVDNSQWSSAKLVSPAYCWYGNNEQDYRNPYGALYNWYAVSSGKLCPIGWRVPSDADWTVLSDYLGGSTLAGGKLKENSTDYWKKPNLGATNEYNFSAMPGGWRAGTGLNDNIGSFGYWWSATSPQTNVAYYRYMYFGNASMIRSFVDQSYGLSVRCIKN